jgi:uncharacterized protein YdhG (YjbR/CyaY superfamily)
VQSKATTVDAYLDEAPKERRAALDTLRQLIRKLAPKAVESMQYGMATYHVNDGMACALASQKQYMALYVGGDGPLDNHRAALGKLNCGKGCIRFKKLEDLPLDTITAILKEVFRQRKAGVATKCK